MGTLRITEAELARDIHAVLAKVQEGAEVIVEHDHRPVVVIRTPEPERTADFGHPPGGEGTELHGHARS